MAHMGARRIPRLGDYSQSVPDIRFTAESKLNHLLVDCKKHASFRQHTLFDEIETKYCIDPKIEESVLLTQQFGEKKTLATIDFDFFIELLERYLK